MTEKEQHERNILVNGLDILSRLVFALPNPLPVLGAVGYTESVVPAMELIGRAPYPRGYGPGEPFTVSPALAHLAAPAPDVPLPHPVAPAPLDSTEPGEETVEIAPLALTDYANLQGMLNRAGVGYGIRDD